MPPAPKTRSVCFTLNNYSEEDAKRILAEAPERLRYVVFGREIGLSGTPHLQGYAYSDGQRSFSWWKGIISNRCHLEATRGTNDEAIAYCKKDGIFDESGLPPRSAAQRGLDESERWELARKAAQEGRLDDVPADIYLRHYRTLKEVSKDHMQVPADLNQLAGVWITGIAGCGKSRKARVDYPSSYLKMANKWWDGYQAQPTVILDDLDKAHACLGHHLKIWTDRYAFLAESKGSAMAIRPVTICVTSQYTIEEIWEDEETRAALNRRFTVILM